MTTEQIIDVGNDEDLRRIRPLYPSKSHKRYVYVPNIVTTQHVGYQLLVSWVFGIAGYSTYY